MGALQRIAEDIKSLKQQERGMRFIFFFYFLFLFIYTISFLSFRAYGSVYRARSPRGDIVALKKMHNRSKIMEHRNRLELRVLYNCRDCQAIVKFFDCYNNVSENEIWLVMELLGGGTLSELTKSHIFKETEVPFVAKSVTAFFFLPLFFFLLLFLYFPFFFPKFIGSRRY